MLSKTSRRGDSAAQASPVTSGTKRWLAAALTMAAFLFAPFGLAEAVRGPSAVKLGDDLATLQLPSGYAFIDKEQGKKLLEAQGGSGEGLLGIVVPTDKSNKSMAVIVRFDDCGYVKDDDAGKLNANEILDSYKEGTKQQNEERKNLGLDPVYIAGWAESPHYEKTAHHVVWAIQGRDQDAETAPVTCVNYNTRILGRKGVLSMNLVTDPENLQGDKVRVAQILDATTFDKGQAYADYQPGKDKAAGFGIAGLILGGGAVAAAAKLGLFGGLWKAVLAGVLIMKKFIIVAIAGIGAVITKLFKKNKGDGQA